MKNRKARKDGRYYVGVSFLETETDLLGHADRYGNFSAYVKNLIRADMNKGETIKEEPATDSEMFKMFMKIMGNAQISNTLQTEKELATGIETAPEPVVEKPKLNKSAINNFIKKR